MAIDNWVNLNDVYVPANGGNINGDLGVKGTLTIDDKTGNNTTYDVANEITALRDSVSVKADTGVSYSITSGRDFYNDTIRYGNIIFLSFNCSVHTMAAWENWQVGTAPIPIESTWAHGTAFYQTGNTAPVPMDTGVTGDGKIYVHNKSGLTLGEGWLFVHTVYVCV